VSEGPPVVRVNRSVGAAAREDERRRWRASILPHWRRLEREVLTAREAKVLSLRLGLVNDFALSQERIARRLHLSHRTIANIERQAEVKVREALEI